MDKKLTIRELLENESFLENYINDYTRQSRRQNSLIFAYTKMACNWIIAGEGEEWYDAIVEKIKLDDLGDFGDLGGLMLFSLYVASEKKNKCIEFTIPQLPQLEKHSPPKKATSKFGLLIKLRTFIGKQK